MCDMKGAEPTVNYHPTLHFHLALQRFTVTFTSLFWFWFRLSCFDSLLMLSQICFPAIKKKQKQKKT